MLSVVAIGRNEGPNIARLARSLQALQSAVPFPVELIFVDSCSRDDSVAIATEYFDTVLELDDSPHLCASAGRFVGTLEARYPWILYVDGDMEVCPDFFSAIADIENLKPEWAGLIGFYIHHLDNGTSAVQTFARRSSVTRGGGIPARQFGGAVILRRDSVISAGNWDPSIYGKEEMELYVRLGNGSPVVRFLPIPMVYHYSEYHSRIDLLKRLLYSSAGLGKVFYGYGQSIRAMATKRNLGALVCLDSDTYSFFVSLLGVLLIAILWSVKIALLALAFVILIFGAWQNIGAVIRYCTLPLPLVTGWFRYFPWFRPLLKRWTSSGRLAR